MFVLAGDVAQVDWSKTLWVTSGVPALIVVLVGTLVQWWLKTRSDAQLERRKAELSKEVEVYKDSLKRDADAEAERLRNKLRLDAFVRETRFQSLQQEQAKVVQETFRNLVRADEALRQYVWITVSEGTTRHDAEGASEEACNRLFEQHTLNQLYFPKALSDQIFDTIKQIRKTHSDFRKWQQLDESNRIPANAPDYIVKAEESIRKQVPPLLEELRAEFRKLIGVNDE